MRWPPPVKCLQKSDHKFIIGLMKSEPHTEPVLLVGSNKLTYSIALCLQKAGHAVVLVTPDADVAKQYVTFDEAVDLEQSIPGSLRIQSDYRFEGLISKVIVVTEENLAVKKRVLAELENIIPGETLIAINTESIPLSDLQQGAIFPERIMGANWVEPAHTTFFLEIIANEITRKSLVGNLYQTAACYWGKDPYVIKGDSGIRMRLFAAMLREAFYLVENDYAKVEDIDRACRNDAGYYLPFAGNLRYMDLMGTYAYGMVMKDLNPELASDQRAPESFQKLLQNGHFGMETNSGLYEYQPGENEKWAALMNRFSQQISSLIDKYPFNYKTAGADQKLSSVHSENKL